jgi:hypothetical protein
LLAVLQFCKRNRGDLFEISCAGVFAWWLLSIATCVGYEQQAHHYDAHKDQAIFLVCFCGGPITALGSFCVFVDRHPEPIFGGITAAATIAIAYFTLTLKKSTDRLWRITKRSADRQASHTKIIERAYINAEPRGVIPFVRGGHADGHVAFRNVGHLPAREVNWFIKVGYDPNVERVQFEPEDLIGGNVILPETESVQWGRGRISQDEFDGLKGNHGFIYVWGRVEYLDGFAKEPRYTIFCHRYESRGFNEPSSHGPSWVDYHDGGAVFHHHGNDAN